MSNEDIKLYQKDFDMKDPAFLFYSKDFYEGTRMMLPEERACYIDLMIYQHQNGIIPNDKRRLLLYCSGIDETTLKNVLNAKFKKVDGGWENIRLSNEITSRENYKSTQSISGKVGQFWKKAKKLLNRVEYSKLQAITDRENLINEIDDINLKDEGLLIGLLKQRLNKYANANEDVNINKEKDKGGVGEKEKEKEKTEDEKSFDRFNEWMDKNTPELRKMKKQPSFEDYCNMKELYNGEQIRMVLLNMANWANITKKNSVYLTFLNWAKRDYQNG